jgi:hypothetical protein
MVPTANPPTLFVTWNTLSKKTGVLMPRHWHRSQQRQARQRHQHPLSNSLRQDLIQPPQRNTYSKVVCKVRPEKGDDTDRTRINISGNNIAYPRDVGTPTGSIELVKLLINSILSQRNARLAISTARSTGQSTSTSSLRTSPKNSSTSTSSTSLPVTPVST